jgi:hypothetical protein
MVKLTNEAGTKNFIMELNKVNNVGNDRYIAPPRKSPFKDECVLLSEELYRKIMIEIYGNEFALPTLRERLFGIIK